MNMTSTSSTRNFVEVALALVLLGILLYSLFTVMSIFFGVFAYAIILAVSFSKIFEKTVRALKGKRSLVAFIYGILMICLIALPFIYIINTLGNYISSSEKWFADIKTNGVPELPEWIPGLPYVGTKIAAFWAKLKANPTETIALYEPQIRATLSHILSGGMGIIGAGLELILGIIVSAVFLTRGEKTLVPIYLGAKKIIGETDGPMIVDAAGRAVKGVAVGVMGTAFIAALAAWIGFSIAGLSFAAGLAAITFFLVLIQVGPLLVWLPVAIWLGMHGETGWTIFVTIYGIVVLMGIDNVLKPVLISKSGKLPILVLFLGVIGGMAAWGFTGMFKGAIILAIFYTITRSWLGTRKEATTA